MALQNFKPSIQCESRAENMDRRLTNINFVFFISLEANVDLFKSIWIEIKSLSFHVYNHVTMCDEWIITISKGYGIEI